VTTEKSDTPDTGYPDNNPKTLLGVTKVPLHLVPPSAKIALAEAFADGAAKYGPYNWREKKVSASIYIAAAGRHMDAWWDGEELSKDAKVHHLNHAMACLAILRDAESIGMLNDDRPFKGAAAALQDSYADKNKKKEQNDATHKHGSITIVTEWNRDGSVAKVVPYGEWSDQQRKLRRFGFIGREHG
jgi:hypothetical protein